MQLGALFPLKYNLPPLIPISPDAVLGGRHQRRVRTDGCRAHPKGAVHDRPRTRDHCFPRDADGPVSAASRAWPRPGWAWRRQARRAIGSDVTGNECGEDPPENWQEGQGPAQREEPLTQRAYRKANALDAMLCLLRQN